MSSQNGREMFGRWLALGRPAVIKGDDGQNLSAEQVCQAVADCDWKVPRRYRELADLQPTTNYAQAARILRPTPQLEQFETHPRKVAFELGWLYARIGDLLVADMQEHYEAFVLGRESYEKEGAA